MIALTLIALAQTPMNLNQQALMVKSGGVSISPVRAITVNCGTNVTCTQTGSTWNLSASGGGGGGGNSVEVSVDFTASAYPVLAATVTGQTWVTASSKIICEPFATDADSQTVETYQVADLSVVAGSRVAGVGFTLYLRNPNGATGTFRFHCLGG